MQRIRRAFRLLSLTLLAVATPLLGYYSFVGQTIDENGTLQEEFWALALGSFALLGAGLSAGIALIARLVRRGATR